MYRIELTVPKYWNDGGAIDAEILEGIESDILDAAGGFSVYDSAGAWRDDTGKVFRDANLVYVVYHNNQHVLDAIAMVVKNICKQQAVMLVVADGCNVQFI